MEHFAGTLSLKDNLTRIFTKKRSEMALSQGTPVSVQESYVFG